MDEKSKPAHAGRTSLDCHWLDHRFPPRQLLFFPPLLGEARRLLGLELQLASFGLFLGLLFHDGVDGLDFWLGRRHWGSGWSSLWRPAPSFADSWRGVVSAHRPDFALFILILVESSRMQPGKLAGHLDGDSSGRTACSASSDWVVRSQQSFGSVLCQERRCCLAHR